MGRRTLVYATNRTFRVAKRVSNSTNVDQLAAVVPLGRNGAAAKQPALGVGSGAAARSVKVGLEARRVARVAEQHDYLDGVEQGRARADGGQRIGCGGCALREAQQGEALVWACGQLGAQVPDHLQDSGVAGTRNQVS